MALLDTFKSLKDTLGGFIGSAPTAEEKPRSAAPTAKADAPVVSPFGAASESAPAKEPVKETSPFGPGGDTAAAAAPAKPKTLAELVTPTYGIESSITAPGMKNEAMNDALVQSELLRHQTEVQKIENNIAGKRAEIQGKIDGLRDANAPADSILRESASAAATAQRALQEAQRRAKEAEETFAKELEDTNKQREAQAKKDLEQKLISEMPKAITKQDVEAFAKDGTLPKDVNASTLEPLAHRFTSYVKPALEARDDSQKEFNTANDHLKAVQSDHSKYMNELKGLQNELAAVNAPLQDEMHTHRDNMIKINYNDPNESAKIAAITERYKKMAEGYGFPSDKKQELADLIDAAAADPAAKRSAADFQKYIENGITDGNGVRHPGLNELGLADKGANHLGPMNDTSKLEQTNLRFSTGPDGKTIVTMNRPLRDPSAPDEVVTLNSSGMIDMSQFKNQTVTITADPKMKDKVLFTNTEEVNMRFPSQLGANGQVNMDMKIADPSKAFEVVGESDKRNGKRLAQGGQLAAAYEMVQEAKQDALIQATLEKQKRIADNALPAARLEGLVENEKRDQRFETGHGYDQNKIGAPAATDGQLAQQQRNAGKDGRTG